jgi:curved DNA-binding protein CbpA
MNNSNNNNDKDLKKYYDILEIDSDATEEEITNAYKYLKSLYSSDSAATLPIDDEWDETDRQEILGQVEEAYTKLMAPAQIEEEPFALEEGDMTAGEQQLEQEPPGPIEFDEEEIPAESIEVELTPAENLVEIEIPSVEEDQEEAFPMDLESKEEEALPAENLEEEKRPAGGLDLDDTLAEVIIEGEPIEKPTEETIEEPIEEPTEEPIEEPTEEKIEEPIEEFIEEPSEEPIEEPIEGMVLRKIRRKQGVTIQDLAESTRIPKKIMEYIEREEYDKLPDAGYLRWYITTFAKALSLDPKDTADQYMKRYRKWKTDQDSQD